MRFSEAFNITRTADDDWFDPHLSVDTKLFVDPLLLLLAGPRWADAHDDLINHFVHCYRLVAQATGPTSVSALAARTLLTFPEPKEFGLGYTAHGTSGAGSGGRFARQMMDGIAVAIARGLDTPEHIEEVGILNEGIGADRISDAACNVLKQRFVEYTQEVATRHGIQVDRHRLRNARCFPEQGRWQTADVELPTNPVTGDPILLVPMFILNDLPILNADDWFDSSLNDDIRTQMNLTLGQKVRKEDIVSYARLHPDRVRRWAREQSSRADLRGYDFVDDRKGVVNWDGLPSAYAAQHPLNIGAPTDQAGLSALVTAMIEHYRHFIEDQRGWSLLWNADGSEKPEEAAQLVLLGMAQHYLRMFNVEVDREVELGRGPVDFKVSSGAVLRVLIELKKAHNGKFWNGLDTQLPSYLTSDTASEGWFVAIRYRSTRASAQRMMDLPSRTQRCAQAIGKTIHYSTVDARPKESASNQE